VSRPVLCVQLNPALDVTYQVSSLVPGRSQRVGAVTAKAGGKAINVAQIAGQLGNRPVIAALLSGDTGRRVHDDLREHGHDVVVVEGDRDTRSCVTIVDDVGTATVLNEPGPLTTGETWVRMRRRVSELIRRRPWGAVVMSGSLPPGIPASGYAELVASAARVGVPTIVDTSGPALREALLAGPTIVKPNRDELIELTGHAGVRGARLMRERAASTTVVASDGPEGLLLLDGVRSYRAVPAAAVRGNPTGAGDALVAALAVGVADGLPIEDTLRLAIGASVAAVLDPVAGHIDLPTARSQAADATLTCLGED
jgi:tagatose 6-phosphate kinase